MTIDYWHFPRPGSTTNSSVKLFGVGGASEEFFSIHKNDQDRWFVQGPFVADYSEQYTHVVIILDTDTGLVDVSIDGQQVASQVQLNANRTINGIRYIGIHSGRGGFGTDSYFDDLIITSNPP